MVSVQTLGRVSTKKVLIGFAVTAVILGGIFSWFASSNPDGLEWSMQKITGMNKLKASDGIHQMLSTIQSRISFLPHYSFKETKQDQKPSSVDGSKSIAGLVGGGMTIGVIFLLGWIIRFVKRKKRK